MATPGILLAWSGPSPVSRILRIPEEGGLVVGRSLAEHDDRISQTHARITWRTHRFEITDLGSRNGTRVDGSPIEKGGVVHAAARSVVRFGGTVGVLVDDIAPFESAEGVTRRPKWTAGRRTATAHAALEDAARRCSHLVVVGYPGIGRGHLARTFATMLAPLKTHIEEEPLPSPEDLIELLDSLACDPDLRLIVTQNTFASPFRAQLDEFLRFNAHRIELPPLRERADEVAAIMHDAVTNIAPQTTCHAELLEYFLVHPRNMNEIVTGIVDVARMMPPATIRVEHYLDAVQRNWVRIIPGN